MKSRILLMVVVTFLAQMAVTYSMSQEWISLTTVRIAIPTLGMLGRIALIVCIVNYFIDRKLGE